MVCKAIHMDSTRYNEMVAGKVAAAIKQSGRSEASIARDTGIALVSLRRELYYKNNASFKVTHLYLIANLLGIDPADFFPEVVAA